MKALTTQPIARHCPRHSGAARPTNPPRDVSRTSNEQVINRLSSHKRITQQAHSPPACFSTARSLQPDGPAPGRNTESTRREQVLQAQRNPPDRTPDRLLRLSFPAFIIIRPRCKRPCEKPRLALTARPWRRC